MVVGLNLNDPPYFGVKEADLSLQNCEEDARPFPFEAVVLCMSSLLTLPGAVTVQ